MNVFTLEIEGHAVAAFNADGQDDAEEFANSGDFTTDLMAFETASGPLWDGESELVVRAASSEEQSKWKVSQAEGIAEGEADEEDAMWVVFLVPVTDPENEER